MCNKRTEQKCLLPNTTHLLNSNGSSNQLLCSSVTPFNASQHIQKSSLMNRWVFYQCTCKVCLGERDRITVDPLSDEWKITSWSWNGARWEEGRRRHVYTCTCSKARKEWPAKGKERPLITADRSQQKSQQPVSDARWRRLWNDPVYSGRVLYHSGSVKSHRLMTPGSTNRRHACSSYTSSGHSLHLSQCKLYI